MSRVNHGWPERSPSGHLPVEVTKPWNCAEETRQVSQYLFNPERLLFWLSWRFSGASSYVMKNTRCNARFEDAFTIRLGNGSRDPWTKWTVWIRAIFKGTWDGIMMVPAHGTVRELARPSYRTALSSYGLKSTMRLADPRLFLAKLKSGIVQAHRCC